MFLFHFLKILHGRPGFKARVHSLSYSHTSHTSLGYKRQVKNWEKNEFMIVMKILSWIGQATVRVKYSFSTVQITNGDQEY